MTGRPHILHVVASLGHGGTEVMALNLIRELRAQGWADAQVVALREGSGALRAAFTQDLGVAPEVLPGRRLARMRAFRQVLSRQPFDAVLFHFFNVEHVALGAVARLLGQRRLAAKAGNPALQGPTRARAIWAGLVRGSRMIGCRVWCSSGWIATSLSALATLPSGSRVIHNGCDVDVIARRADLARASRAPGPVRLGMVSRLDPIKDHETLLQAFARLPGDLAAELQIIGDGTLAGGLEAQARALGVDGRVRFVGARNDIPEILGGLDLFVMSTTRDEGFGIVLIEALAAGVPIIASDVPACREVLRDGALGRLVPPADPAALAAAIEQALTMRPQVPDTEMVAAHYGMKAMARACLDLLGLSPARTAPESTAA